MGRPKKASAKRAILSFRITEAQKEMLNKNPAIKIEIESLVLKILDDYTVK